MESDSASHLFAAATQHESHTAVSSAQSKARRRVERQVASTIVENSLWSAHSTLIVGVSGGADSLCLLGCLLDLRSQGHRYAPGDIIVAHLDHQLRGEESVADAQWVADFAKSLGLRCFVEQVDVAALARDQHRSLEDAARTARYAFLRRAAAEVGAVRICVGHTQDDQIETLVMHWLRGAGLNGLSGMPPLSNDVARPMLNVTHDEAEAYCSARGWQPRVDSTNADLAYTRNRLRHELLPVLRSYNPAFSQSVIRNASLIADDERYLDEQAAYVWQHIVSEVKADAFSFRRAALVALPAALRHRVFRRAARQLAPAGIFLEARHLIAMDRLITYGRTNSEIHISGYLRAHLDYDMFILECHRTSNTELTAVLERAVYARLPLDVPGMVELAEQGWRVRAWASDRPPGAESDIEPAPPVLPSFSLMGNTSDIQRAETRVYLDRDRTGERLWVRFWQPGDRFQPLGMPHEKKLQDYFADAKAPRALRHTIPLIVNEKHPIWIAGLRIDNRVRITSETQHVLVLQLEPL